MTYYFLVTALDAAGAESRPSNEVVLSMLTSGGSSSLPAAGLSNISARSEVLTAASAIIDGFVIGGTDNHTVVVRGLGPTLSSVGVAGVLADPFLALHQTDAQGNDHVLASNDNWRDTQESAINRTGLARQMTLKPRLCCRFLLGVTVQFSPAPTAVPALD